MKKQQIFNMVVCEYENDLLSDDINDLAQYDYLDELNLSNVDKNILHDELCYNKFIANICKLFNIELIEMGMHYLPEIKMGNYDEFEEFINYI